MRISKVFLFFPLGWQFTAGGVGGVELHIILNSMDHLIPYILGPLHSL